MPASTLVRDGDQLVLETPDIDRNAYVANLPGVSHEYGPTGAVLRKCFPVSRFLSDPDVIERAVNSHREGPAVKVFGMSGYSDLGAGRCAQLGIRQGQYEAVVSGMFTRALLAQQKELPGANLRLVFGSSDTGVDLEIKRIAHWFGIPLLGFTCPDYLWWVDAAADGPTICVCADKVAYAQTYVAAVDILFAANGGPVSFEMDTYAALKLHKTVLAINVLAALGAHPQAYDGDKVLDAVAALEETLQLAPLYGEVMGRPDPYEALCKYLGERVVGLLRRMLPPAVGYPDVTCA